MMDDLHISVRMDVLQANRDRIEALQRQIIRWKRQLNRLEEHRADLELTPKQKVSLEEDIWNHKDNIEKLTKELEDILNRIYGKEG